MEIRKIKKEELLQSHKISSIAFEYRYDCKVDENATYPTEHSEEYGAFDDNNKLMARMEVISHKVYLDGNIVDSTGIGGVATLPEFRHNKAIRSIFELVFEDMREKKQYISQLYPFSYAYYNKFGYQTVYDRMRLRFSLNLLKDEKIERNNRCVLIEDNKNADMREVYEKYASWHNSAYNRDDKLWNIKLSDNIYSKRHYPYVYYNENGKPSGYFIFTPDNKDHDFMIVEMCYETIDDIKGMLGFIRNFEADYRHITLSNLPAAEDFSMMFSNQHDIERSSKFMCMTRIADVKKIFEIMKYPQENGSFSISVDDGFQEFNKGVYHISYKDGKATDIEQKTFGSSEADIETSVTSLANLVFGSDDLCAFRHKFMNSIKINSNIETLKKVFVRKHIYMGDDF